MLIAGGGTCRLHPNGNGIFYITPLCLKLVGLERLFFETGLAPPRSVMDDSVNKPFLRFPRNSTTASKSHFAANRVQIPRLGFLSIQHSEPVHRSSGEGIKNFY